jgi:DNA-binding transcriptional LysR family regulator
MQSLARMDVTLLTLFEALEAERNLTRAAARIGMAQPSASKALDRLRDLFADPLFLRMPGGMRPTPRATELAPQIAAALAQLRALVAEELPFDPATARGRLRLAMSDAAEFMMLPRLVALLAARAPLLTLQARPLDKDRAFLLLDEGRLDAVIGVFPERPKRIEAVPLFAERFVCLARADHPALVNGLSLDAFTTLPHLLVTLRDDARGAVDEALSRIGRQRRVLATMARFLAIPAVLARSDAIATVPARFAAGAQGCRQHEPPIAIPGWTEQLLWRAGAERDPLVGWALALIREAARGD